MGKSTGRKDAPQGENPQPCAFIGCCGCRMCDHATSQFPPLPSTNSVPRTSRITSLLSELSPLNLNTEFNETNQHRNMVMSPMATPSKSYAEVSGSPSPRQKRDNSSSDVNLETSSNRDNLSVQIDDVINDKSPNDDTSQVSITILTKDPTADKNKLSPRYCWTNEENVELFKCYCEATSKNMNKIKGTYEIWRSKNQDIRINMNANTLGNQRRLIEKKLTNKEKDEILRIVNAFDTETNMEEQSINQSNNYTIERVEEDTPPNSTALNNIRSNWMEGLEETEELTEMQEELIVRFEQAKMNNFEDRNIAKRFVMHKDNRERVENMNKILTAGLETSHIKVTNLLELNALHHAAAITLAGAKEIKTAPKPNHNPNEIIDEEINKVRKWIGRLTATADNTKLTPKVNKYLKGESAETVMHRLKMKLNALCKKRRTRIAAKARFQNNKLFKFNQKAFYAKLRNGGGEEKVTDPPTKENIQKYWGGLFGDKALHNDEAEWLVEERKEMEGVEEAVWIDISPEKLTKSTKKLSNWKAPGLDKVQNFWIKYLTALHPLLAEYFNEEMNQDENKSEWLTGGKTTLLYKKGNTNEAKNYRPITCLPTYYKLFTLILTDNIHEHVTTNNILPLEQKGIRRKERGCKDHLILDKIITEDAKRKKRNLSVMWIDYQKAYDSIPHSWLIAMMRLYKIDDKTIKFIIKSMPSWRTKIHLPHSKGCLTTEDISFLRGIFQGDTLSPLLFCLALAPIRNILKRANIGYKIGGKKVSNLLYIDDLKCYAKDDNEMERCRALIDEFSTDIAMTFGLEKCAVVHMKKGQMKNSPTVEEIPILEQEESYKYLGILQNEKIMHDKSKVNAKKEFFNRVRLILKAELNAKNTTDAIKTYAMPIMRYGFGVLKWTSAELRNMDRKVRKALTKGRFHHPKSNTHRLHLARKEGGRGLIGVEDCHRQECTKLAEYLITGTDDLSKIICEAERPKKHGILSFLEPPKKGQTTEIDKEHEDGLKEMKLHGQYFKVMEDTPNINLALSRSWLVKPYFRYETESLICAAQEQALATNHTRSKIWGTGKSSLCRLCKEKNETIHHIVSGCKMLCGTQYMYRHNQVAKYIHWQILKDLNVKVHESWMKHIPTEVTIKNGIKILWDSYIITEKKVPHNRPDIIIFDTNVRECLIIDVAIPVCMNVVKKEAEKITKYRDLEIEIQKCWGLKKIRTIPIVIGALGSVCNGINGYLGTISKNLNFDVIQRTALLGTAHILRNFLTPVEKTTK